MLQSDERMDESELIGHLKSLKLTTMNPTTDEQVLGALRGQNERVTSKSHKYRWLGGTMAGVAGLCIASGLVFALQRSTYQNFSTASNGQQNVSSTVLKPSSVTHEHLSGATPATTYTYTESEAIAAMKQLVKFKVKEPVAVEGFSSYRVRVVDTVPDSGNRVSQQNVSFVSMTVPGKTDQFNGQSRTDILKTHKWRQYSVTEFSAKIMSPHFTSRPYLKTVDFDGVQVKVYTDKYHDGNVYTFPLNGHFVSVEFSAGNYKLGVDPLTDKNAWRIIGSLVQGNSYLN